MEDNPYLLTGEPLHLKFSQVDAIAARLQFEHDGSLRVGAGLVYAMRHNANNGHTCLPRDKLLQSTARFLRVEPDRVAEGLESLLTTGDLRLRRFDGTDYVYLPDLLSAEEDIAACLRRLASYPHPSRPNSWRAACARWSWARASPTRRCKGRPSSRRCPAG